MQREFPKIQLSDLYVERQNVRRLAPNLILINDVLTMHETHAGQNVSGRYWSGDIWVWRADGGSCSSSKRFHSSEFLGLRPAPFGICEMLVPFDRLRGLRRRMLHCSVAQCSPFNEKPGTAEPTGMHLQPQMLLPHFIVAMDVYLRYSGAVARDLSARRCSGV